MMHPKTYPIQIWFLDEDLQKSAQMLSDKFISKSVNGCIQALISARFYYIGIRSKKFYSHFFSKENREETLERFFPLWPNKNKPSFSQYSSRVSKWTRMCFEHYDLIRQYLKILLDEYEFRMTKIHSGSFFYEWEINDAPQLDIPLGNLKKICFEWKSLNPKYRNKDICLGYREQYKTMVQNYGVKSEDYSRRDIPEFLLDISQKEEQISKFLE